MFGMEMQWRRVGDQPGLHLKPVRLSKVCCANRPQLTVLVPTKQSFGFDHFSVTKRIEKICELDFDAQFGNLLYSWCKRTNNDGESLTRAGLARAIFFGCVVFKLAIGATAEDVLIRATFDKIADTEITKISN